MVDIKKELKKIGFGILYVLAIFYLIRFLKLGTWGIILLLSTVSIGFMLFKAYKTNTRPSFKQMFINVLSIMGLVWFIRFLGAWGVFGYFGTCIILALLILVRRRKRFIKVKHQVESMLWGKPLYQFRESGEKPPKIKVSF